MSGVKGRSGRKRKIRNIVKYFNDMIDLNSAKLVDITIEKALQGDREMIIYCWDRRLGKPTQQTSLDISGGEALSAAYVMNLFRMIRAERERLELEERKPTLELEEGKGENGGE